ncbi:MAG: hypothetical protein ABIO82_07960 [Ginsengibacter sp.]
MTEPNSDKKSSVEEEKIKRAQDEALKDIQKDPSVNMEPKPLKDLDEGELARSEAGV